MTQMLSYFPGQKFTVFLETKDSDGYYSDGYYTDGYDINGFELPVVQRIIGPDIISDGYYPQPMVKIDTGLYYYSSFLSKGSVAIGSYFVDIAYRESNTRLLKFKSYQLLVNAPFGLYSVTNF